MTGMPIAMCASAWKASGENLDKAVEILKSKGAAKAEKLKDRDAKAGYFAVYRHHDGKNVAAVALACETDFVSKTAEFRALADELAMHLAASDGFTLKDDFLESELISRQDRSTSVREVINELSAKSGEKIDIHIWWSGSI
jgi:elongation factor Ts